MKRKKLNLNPWCKEHWKPYNDGAGPGLIASQLLWSTLVNDRDFINLCQGNAKVMFSMAMKLAPICCHFGDDVMDNILKEAVRIREKDLH